MTNYPLEYGKWQFEREEKGPYYNQQRKKKRKRIKKILDKIEKRKQTTERVKTRGADFQNRLVKKSSTRKGRATLTSRQKALDKFHETYSFIIEKRIFEKAFLHLQGWQPTIKRRNTWKIITNMILASATTRSEPIHEIYKKYCPWLDYEDIKQEILLALWQRCCHEKEASINSRKVWLASLYAHDNTFSLRKQIDTYKMIHELLSTCPRNEVYYFDGVGYLEGRDSICARRKIAKREPAVVAWYYYNHGIGTKTMIKKSRQPLMGQLTYKKDWADGKIPRWKREITMYREGKVEIVRFNRKIGKQEKKDEG